MKPVSFRQANGTLIGGPAVTYGTDEDVADLPVMRTSDGQIISAWVPTWKERLRLILGHGVYLFVAAAQTHHPVALGVGRIDRSKYAPVGDAAVESSPE